MKPAAIGVRAHSGWGAVVVVAGEPGALEVLERARITIVDPEHPGARQPYHFAKEKPLPIAEQYLANCAAISERLATEAFEAIVRKHRPVSCAILQGAGRPLPDLAKILAAHPLIHTAEGEFFRAAFRNAAEYLGLKVEAIPERELDARSAATFGKRAIPLQQEIAALGKSMGPPWTTDHKAATLAALLLLA